MRARYRCHVCGATVPADEHGLLAHPMKGTVITCPAKRVASAPIDAECPFCKKRLMLTATGELRFHKRKGGPVWESCDGSSRTPADARAALDARAARLLGGAR